MSLEDLVLASILGALASFLVLDRVRPGRALPVVRFWRTRGLVALVVSLALGTIVPLLAEPWLAAHRLLDLGDLGIAGGVAVGLLAQQTLAYAWHRALHRVPFLWRWFHQMHHSAERLDVYGAFYFHPFDISAFTLVASVSLVWVAGVPAEAAIIVNGLATVLAFLQHANLKTPRWLGYFVQRPESHTVHHQRGLHAYNYADLPIFDIIFGTFRNPERFAGETGFYDGASARVPRMLVGGDVSSPPPDAERASVGRPVPVT